MADINKISFDFDDTLSTEKGQEMAKRFIDEGKTVYIITARQRRMSAGVYEVADQLGIPHTRIYFTNGADKWETIKRLDIGIHYDNNQEQIDKINEYTDCDGRLFTA